MKDRYNGFKKLLGTLVLCILVITFVISTGCLEQENEEPEDVIMEVIETDVQDAGEGMEYLWLKVSIQNDWDEEIQVDATWFEVETREGLIIDDPREDGMEPYLEVGETDEFWLIFEISEDLQAVTLWFRSPLEQPTSWTDI